MEDPQEEWMGMTDDEIRITIQNIWECQAKNGRAGKDHKDCCVDDLYALLSMLE